MLKSAQKGRSSMNVRGSLRVAGLVFGLVVTQSVTGQAGFLDDLDNVLKDVGEGIEKIIPGGSEAANSLFPGLLSASFAQWLSGGDVSAHEAALMGALATGAIQSWDNPETGNSGEVKVLEETTTTEETEVVVLKDKVEEVPPLKFLGVNYTANGSANVHGGPGTDYKVVSNLPEGTVVHVVGKVEAKDWYMVSQGDVATGFVFANLLEETATTAASETEQPAGPVETVETTAQQTCKTVEQSVTLDDGSTKTDVITACQGPNGWEIVEA